MKSLSLGLSFAVLSSVPLIAQGNDAQTGIQEMFITASPLVTEEDQLAGSVNKLDSAELVRKATSNLGETLDSELGIVSSSFGPGVGVPVIRGQSGKRVEILQNGNIIADVSDTSSDHAVATNPLLANQIEVLRGPATLRHGTGAIGGVVNVIDSRLSPEQVDGVTGAVTGMFDTNGSGRDYAALGQFGNGELTLTLDAASSRAEDTEIPGLANEEADDPDETTDGYIGNTDIETESYGLGLNWSKDNIHLGISYAENTSDYGLPEGTHGHHHHEDEHHDEHDEHDEHEGAHEDDHDDHDDHDEDHHDEHGDEEEVQVRIDLEQTQWSAIARIDDVSDLIDSLEANFSYSDYEHFEVEIEDGTPEIGTLFANQAWEIHAELVHKDIGGWTGAFGVQRVERDFEAAGEEAFVPNSTTNSLGVYLTERTRIGMSTLELGLRADNNKVESKGFSDIEHDTFNISSSLLVPLSDEQSLAFSLGRSERAPVAEELLSDGNHVATSTYEIGDTNLDTERAVSVEASYRLRSMVDFTLTVFHNDFSNYIYLHDTELLFNEEFAEENGTRGLASCTTEEAFDHEEEAEEANECFVYLQDGAKFTGVEAQLGFPISESQEFRLWADSVRAELDNGNDVPRMPPARFGASWTLNNDSYRLQLDVTKALEQDRPGEGQEKTDGYVRVDAYAEATVSEVLLVFMRARNLFDEDIRNSTSFLREAAPEPGRSLTFGVKYSF